MGVGGRNLQGQKGGILSVIIYREPPLPRSVTGTLAGETQDCWGYGGVRWGGVGNEGGISVTVL